MHQHPENQIQHPTAGSASSPPRASRFAFAREDGQALVELAFVLPILILLVFGIVRFGLALNSANDETHLANEVARYATVNENPGCAKEPCAGGLAAWGKSQADSSALKGQSLCIRFLKDASTGTTKEIGDPVEVILKGKIQWLPVIEGGPEITRRAVMRLEAAPTHYGEECA
jgi:hypothetical protein